MDLQTLNPLSHPKQPASRKILQYLFKTIAYVSAILLVGAILAGLPIQIGHWHCKLKNFKPFFLVFIAASILSAWFSKKNGREGIISLRDKFQTWASEPQALWSLFIVASLFFTWQQITEYLSLQINFLPFSFFDYMLYYYFHGKIHFTGQLHTFYHINNIMFLIAPLWAIFKSSLVLIITYGPLAALGIFPLAGIVRKRFGNASIAWVIAFIYLNYRYLQNVLQMNFCVEIFYPLFIFCAVNELLARRWKTYYLFVVLGLLVKEDSFIYFSGIGLLTALTPKNTDGKRCGWFHGAATIILSCAYFIFITKFFIPWTGNTVLRENYHNFGDHISSGADLIAEYAREPMRVIKIFFGDPAKIRTYLNLLFRVAFLPFFTPAGLLILVPIFPVFAHSTGRDTDFYDLHFHYAATVFPFVFIAFVFGFSNLYRKIAARWREIFLWSVLLLLSILNSGHFRTERFTPEDIKSIRWAKEVPWADNVLTHGHLLPYIGYHEYNYYFAQPWEDPKHPAHLNYVHADYVLLDKHVNPYPWDAAQVERKLTEYQNNPEYESVMTDGTRTLFKRKNK